MPHAARIAAVLVVPIVVLAVATPPAPAAVIDDHPLITRYPDSVPSRRDEAEFQEYKLITGVVADSLDFDSIDLGGRVTRISYQNPRDRSSDEILANYEQAISGAGGEVLFVCRNQECGPTFAGSRWGRFNGTIHLPGVGGYVAGRIASGEATAFVAIGVAKRRHQVTVIEVQEMETGLVTIDPEALGRELDRLGHVAIPGVHFETGKAELTAGSAEALAAMAAILGERPALKVWIVGHTDWTGGFDLNMQLSGARARAVARALVETHSIDAGRLEGHGVGPLTPAAGNTAEAGRAANRRVELVARP